VALCFYFSYKLQLVCILVFFEVGTGFFLNWCHFLDHLALNASILDHQNVLHIVVHLMSQRYNYSLTPSFINA